MEREPLVLRLDQIGRRDIHRAGGKAANLGELTRAGLPVPPGFCITVAAFRCHLQAAGAHAVAADLARAAPAEEDARRQLAAAVRARIESGPLPADLEAALLAAWHDILDRAPCAVRSSATAEDLSQASRAGQYETVLHVREPDALLRAVRTCWASLFSDRALAYRARSGLDGARVDMGVVVQRMVLAESAGVLFTIDPLSSESDDVLIEASYGLGESVVSGRVTPDRFRVRRDPLGVRERVLSSKPIELALDERGGVREQSVAPERAARAALSDQAAERLAQLGLAAERLFGGPQDLEWVVVGEELFVLQSRPITRPARAAPAGDGQVWTNMNVGEILPDVVSPLTWSVMQRTLLPMFEQMLAAVGIDLRQHPIFGLVAGRVYFNLSTATAAVRAMPFGRHIDLTSSLGGLHGDLERSGALAAIERNLPRVAVSWRAMLRRLPGTVASWLLGSIGRPDRRLARVAARLAEREQRNLDSLDHAALMAEFNSCVGELWADYEGLAVRALVGATAFNTLDHACSRWFPDEPGVATQLAMGIGGMASAEAGLDLWRLAMAARCEPEVKRVLAAGGDFAATRAGLSDSAAGRAYLARWQRFMARHGHHARGEIELMNARWSEEPDFVLGQVRSYLGGAADKDPLAIHAGQGRARIERTAALRARLRNPLRRLLFDRLVRRARRGLVYRENLKSEYVHLMAHQRRIALQIGRRLAARGVLGRPDDVFYLHLDELADAPAAARSSQLRRRVGERRMELERNRSVQPPAVVVGEFDPERVISRPVDGASDCLVGLGVSPGVVTGSARVILRSDAAERVLAGEILVAPFTDPGWTPYFQLAGGLVTDLGGILSHGSIIAREYGLPAVANVAHATRVIRTGDRLQVDGTRGEVRILKATRPVTD